MKTPGQALRADLDRTLGAGMAWDETELVTLSSIEAAADRLAVFRARFEESAADPKSSPSRLATLSGECRLLEGAIAESDGDTGSERQPGEVDAARARRQPEVASGQWHIASRTPTLGCATTCWRPRLTSDSRCPRRWRVTGSRTVRRCSSTCPTRRCAVGRRGCRVQPIRAARAGTRRRRVTAVIRVIDLSSAPTMCCAGSSQAYSEESRPCHTGPLFVAQNGSEGRETALTGRDS